MIDEFYLKPHDWIDDISDTLQLWNMFSFFHYQINLKILLQFCKSLKKNFIRNIFTAKEVKFDVKRERLLLYDPAIDHLTAQIRDSDYRVSIFTCDVTEALMPTPMAGRISTWNWCLSCRGFSPSTSSSILGSAWKKCGQDNIKGVPNCKKI